MRYRRLGIHGPTVSVIGFGASPLGNVFGKVDSQAAQGAVAAAVDRGINLFDVSPYYGLTVAEERLGRALRGSRDRVILGTKCGRYGIDNFDFSAKTIVKRFEDSLQRLGTEYVDLLQAHDVEFGDRQQLVGETIPALLRLKEQGKARWIGVTGYWPGFLAKLATETKLDCVLNYCHANLFNDDYQETLVPLVEQKGVGLLNGSPLHMGLLGNRPVPEWHPAPREVQEAAEQVRSVCDDTGTSAASVALHFCLELPAIASMLIGFSSEEEVSAACDVLDWSPPNELLGRVETILAPVHNMVWPSGHAANQDTTPPNDHGSHDAH